MEGNLQPSVEEVTAAIGAVCVQVITFHSYSGRVSGLAAGTYQFEVVHQAGTSRSTALTAQVTVS